MGDLNSGSDGMTGGCRMPSEEEMEAGTARAMAAIRKAHEGAGLVVEQEVRRDAEGNGVRPCVVCSAKLQPSELETCGKCHAIARGCYSCRRKPPIDPVFTLGAFNRPDAACRACREAELQRVAARDAAKLISARDHALMLVPVSWVDDDILFREKVRNPRLLRIDEKYERKHGNLAILGTTELGKTAVVARVVRKFIRSATDTHDPMLNVMWVTGYALAMARRDAPLGDEPGIIRRARTVSVLVIDEFTGRPDDGTCMDVLNERYQKDWALTIITSGATQEEIEAAHGKGCFRRFTDPHGQLIQEWGSAK